MCTKLKSIHTFTWHTYTIYIDDIQGTFDWQPEWKIELHFFQKHEKNARSSSVNNFDAKIFENYGGKKNNLLYILSLFHKWKIIAVWTFENTEQDPEARPEVWIMQFKMQPINDAKTIIKWQLKNHSFLKMNEYKYIIFYSSLGKIFYKMSSN